MQKKIAGLELSGLPGTGKSHLVSSFEKTCNYEVKYFKRDRIYKNTIAKIICIPIVVIFFKNTIKSIYLKKKKKRYLRSFLNDYLKMIYAPKTFKNDKTLSKVFLLYTAVIDFLIIAILKRVKIQFIIDEGVFQKAIGLVLRQPSIKLDILLKEFSFSKYILTNHIIIKPNSFIVYKKMIKNRNRSNKAIKKWVDDNYSYNDLLSEMSLFIDYKIKKDSGSFITHEIINNYDEKSELLFTKTVRDLVRYPKLIFIK